MSSDRVGNSKLNRANHDASKVRLRRLGVALALGMSAVPMTLYAQSTNGVSLLGPMPGHSLANAKIVATRGATK